MMKTGSRSGILHRESLFVLICIMLLFAVVLCIPSVVAVAGLHGDVDNSGDVSAADARMILRAAVDLERLSPRQIYIADCNADGEITAGDARLALRAAVGLETLDSHFFKENENGELICVICGCVSKPAEPDSQESTTVPDAREETTTRDPSDDETETTLPSDPTEPVTEPEPGPPVCSLRLNDEELILGEEFDQTKTAFGRFMYESHTVSGLTTFVYSGNDGGVLFVFTDSFGVTQAFFVLSPHFSFDGVSAGDPGDTIENNADMTLFYDLSPYGGDFASLPDRRFFCDVYGQNLVYAAFCRLPGVSFQPDIQSASFFDDCEKEMLSLTSAFRSFYGISALTDDAELGLVARAHSAEMAQYNYFSHDSLNGSPFNERIDDAGITYRITGENITAGSDFSWEALYNWVISKGHRKNLLDTSFLRLGVGVAYNASSRYKLYWTQDFAG